MSRLDRRTFLKLGTGALLGAPFVVTYSELVLKTEA